MAKKLSIIIPAFNAEKYLDRCLESISEQTFADWEAVVIDDGSTDGTPFVADSWSQVDSRIRVIHQKNSGAKQARNNAFEYITGEWVTFVDSDDYIEKGTYAAVFNELEKKNAQVCVFGAFYHYINSSGEQETENKHIPGGSDEMTGEQAMCSLMYNDYEAGDGFIWNKVFNVAALKKQFDGEIPQFFTEIYEDKSWLLRVFSRLDCVIKVRRPLYHYNVLPESLSHNSKNEIKRLLAGVEVFSQIVEEYKDSSEPVVEAAKAHYYMKTAQSLLRSLSLRSFKTARFLAKSLKGHNKIILNSEHFTADDKSRFKSAIFVAKIIGI